MRKFILGFVALISISVGATFAANYQMTQGSGTTFGSLLIGGINYAQHLICDATTPAQCANVDTHGQQIIDVNTTSNNLYGALTSPTVAGTNRIGYTSDDPCAQKVKTVTPIGTASGNLQLVAPSGSTKVYVCSLSLIAAATAVVNIIEGTGAACTTANEAAVIGSTTAASGMSLAANGGLTLGNGGATIGVTATAANGICLLQSGTTALAGNITWVQQ